MPAQTDGWNTLTYDQNITRRFWSEAVTSTKFRHIPMSEYVSDILKYNQCFFSRLNSNCIFWYLMTLNFITTKLSAQRTFFDVLDEQRH